MVTDSESTQFLCHKHLELLVFCLSVDEALPQNSATYFCQLQEAGDTACKEDPSTCNATQDDHDRTKISEGGGRTGGD
jgi:hypothetical protein